MTIAVFKPGGDVWGKLEQKVIDMAELPGHIAEGWFEKAQDALDAHDLAKLEAENAKLAAQIADEQVKLDGRTKAARDLKAKSGNVEATAETDSSLSQNSMTNASDSQQSATNSSEQSETVAAQ